MPPLSRSDRSVVTSYINAIVAQPSHFNSLKVNYLYGAARQYVEEIATLCGVARGLKGSRLELPDLKNVAERVQAMFDANSREIGSEMLKEVNNQLRYYTQPSKPTKSSSPVSNSLDTAFDKLVAEDVAQKPAKVESYNPYAAHTGTGRCPTCRQPLPGSGR